MKAFSIPAKPIPPSPKVLDVSAVIALNDALDSLPGGRVDPKAGELIRKFRDKKD